MSRYYIVVRPGGDYEPDRVEVRGKGDTTTDISKILSTGAVTKILKTNEEETFYKEAYNFYKEDNTGGKKIVIE